MGMVKVWRRFWQLPRAEKVDVLAALIQMHFLVLMFVVSFVSALTMQLSTHHDALGRKSLTYPAFLAEAASGHIATVALSDDAFERRLFVTDKEGKRFAVIPPVIDRELFAELDRHGLTVEMKPEHISLSLIIMRAFLIGLFAAMMATVYRMYVGGAAQEGSAINLVSRRPARFDDIIGCDDVRDEFREAIDFLRFPERFNGLGARAPRGILLYGPPGVGKTLLARAAAHEAGACFMSRTAADFNQMYIGLAGLKLRLLFAQARRRAPAVIFIDEFETLGRARDSVGGSAGVREQHATLNQLLAEMDGFTGNEGVLVIAATNHPDGIDPALRRPGRFDRQIHVSPPDQQGRRALFDAFLSRKPRIADDIDTLSLARATPGFAGAQIEGMVNEAAIIAARGDAPAIGMGHLLEARDRVLIGLEHRHRTMIDEERRILAIHEAGHAVVARLLMPERPVERVSITPRGRTGGHTLLTDHQERLLPSRDDLQRQISVLLAGRAAEQLVCGEAAVTVGASDDLDKANTLARLYCDAGFSEQLGLLRLGSEGRGVSALTLRERDMAMQALLTQCLERAMGILRSGRAVLEALAAALVEHEVLDREGVERIWEAQVRRAAGGRPDQTRAETFVTDCTMVREDSFVVAARSVPSGRLDDVVLASDAGQ
jgi:cell division protease FtsH